MSTLFGSRQRAEDFAARIDGGRSDEPGRRASNRVSHESDLLVDVVAGLRQHAELDERARPRATFTSELRERLMAEAAMIRREGPQAAADLTDPALRVLPSRPRRLRERLVVAGASAAILIGGTAGVADAAQSALPGQALYPVKRSIEKVDARLSGSPSARGRALLDQASTRLDEVQGLDAGGPVERELIPGTLKEFTRQANAGALLLMQGFRETDDPKSIEEVRAFAADQLPVLTTLSDSTSDGAKSQLWDAAVALRSIDSEANDACSACSDLLPLDVPSMELASAGVDTTDDSSGGVVADPADPDRGATTGVPADGQSSTGTTPPLEVEGELVPPADGSSSQVPTPVPESDASPSTAPGSTLPTDGSQPVTGTGTSPTDSTAVSGTPGAVAAPSSGSAPNVSAPPRVPVVTVPSSGSTTPTVSTPPSVAVPAPSPVPAPTPVPAPDPVPAPAPTPAPDPVATPPSVPVTPTSDAPDTPEVPSTTPSDGDSGGGTGSDPGVDVAGEQEAAVSAGEVLHGVVPAASGVDRDSARTDHHKGRRHRAHS